MRKGMSVVGILLLFQCLLYGQLLKPQDAVEQKIEKLLKQMTLTEKLGQMAQYSFNAREAGDLKKLLAAGKVGSFLNVRNVAVVNELQKIAVEKTRLGIPIVFGNDVIHGYRTIFPISLAEAASWNPELVQKAASVAAREAYASGTRWTFAPMLDIARDPRWGRISEGAGEDPYLGSVMAAARVKGFQGASMSDEGSIVACAKHYVGYGGAEGGRDYNGVEMSLSTLYDIYLPPFQAAVNAGAGTIMSAFEDLNGIPASANEFIIKKVLRNEWGFQGFVVSDWASIKELVNHGFAATPAEAGEKALNAGVDMDMEGDIYAEHITAMVEKKQISMAVVDEAVRRILRIKFLSGLFDTPYTNPDLEKKEILHPDHLNTARQMARESIVLLKNTNSVLPLAKSISTLVVIGPLADSKLDPLGSWFCEGRSEEVVTLLQGIKEAVSQKTRVLYAKGCAIEGDDEREIESAVRLAQEADVILAVVGERGDMSGEAASRSSLDLPGKQLELVKALHGTGKPVVVVLMNGRPLSIPWITENVSAILETWFGGVQAGHAIADVLFGDYNPSGKLPVTVPRTVGQVPLYYNHKNTGRPATKDKFSSKYLDVATTPLYPFGYGLSYTSFRYADLALSSKKIELSDSVTISVILQNTGVRAGKETVQLYVQDIAGSMTRPVKELKEFQSVELKAGESKKVIFHLAAQQLGFHNQILQYVVEPGKFKVWIGTNSEEGLDGAFDVITK
ncbi:MAG: beta-glucosidase BglX [bacterium]